MPVEYSIFSGCRAKITGRFADSAWHRRENWQRLDPAYPERSPLDLPDDNVIAGDFNDLDRATLVDVGAVADDIKKSPADVRLAGRP